MAAEINNLGSTGTKNVYYSTNLTFSRRMWISEYNNGIHQMISYVLFLKFA